LIDFKTKTGKEIGKVKITELAEFIGISEGALRNRRKKNPKEFDIYYLGALCIANDIKKEDLKKLLKIKNIIE
jgi:hypothetical protein